MSGFIAAQHIFFNCLGHYFEDPIVYWAGARYLCVLMAESLLQVHFFTFYLGDGTETKTILTLLFLPSA